MTELKVVPMGLSLGVTWGGGINASRLDSRDGLGHETRLSLFEPLP